MDRVSLDRWFVAEVLPVEARLVSYLRQNCRVNDDVVDLRQDVYVRVYESAAIELPENVPAFIFATARNLLIDRARRAKIVPIETHIDLESFDGGQDDLSPERHAAGRADLRLLQRALDDLPAKCRRVVELRKIECMSQREVAQHLGITEDTVERHISNGMRSLAAALLANGIVVATSTFARRFKSRIGSS